MKRRASAKKPLTISERERERRNDVELDFVRIEIELADTFSKMALEMHSQERAQQLRFNAHRAMDAALHALAEVRIEKKDRDAILTRLEEVKALLGTIDGNNSPASC